MQHFSLSSLLLTSAALLSLVAAAPAPVPQSADAFFDDTEAPDPDTVDVESSKTEAVATKAECRPTSYATPRAFELVASPGPHCTYQSFVELFETDSERQQGIKTCKNKCTKDARCRAFSWFLDSANPDVGNCWLAADFYNPSITQCSADNTNKYLAVYNVTNWTPPNPLVPNGDFESGCFKPWFFQDFTSDGSMKKTVVRCKGSDCAPNGGRNHVRIVGNGEKGGPNGGTRDRIDAYIAQQPALLEDVNYKLSAYIRGDSGEFRFTYPSHTSVVIRANATTTWQKVEGTFTGRNVGTFLIQMDAPGRANFAIDNVEIVQV